MPDEAQTTTKKHKQFVSEPMGEKPVTDLPGIGDEYGEKLRKKGFEKAYHVFAKFLMLNKDEEEFTKWFKETTSGNTKDAKACYTCLKEWSDKFFN